jgi:CheY-like chemotaxis protein
MIEPQAMKRGISMQFPRFDIAYFLNADRTRLKQVLINLLFNAVKYNKPRGSVSLDFALVRAGTMRISVRDTGAGLAPEQLAQLFQPFNRLGKESSVEEGTGIGLVVTKRLVELMEGTIGADSFVGVGSVFWVELNLIAAPKLRIPEADLLAITGAPVPAGTPMRTLLYVEDNPANLELIEQLVARRPDLRLLTAADGELGVEFARAYQPEVILMDVNLPGISGIEAMQILSLDAATAHIPIIALSANAVPYDIEKALEAGFFNYLTKPIKVGQFMNALDAAFKHAQSNPSTATTRERA